MLINEETGLPYTVPEVSGLLSKVPRLKKTLSSHIQVISSGLRTSTTAIDRKNGKVGIISSKPYNAPATQIEVGGYKPIPIMVPHYPAEVTIKPEEVDGLRKAGTIDEYVMPGTLLQEKMSAGTGVFDAVEEKQVEGAIRGHLIDADGTVAADLTPLGAPTTDTLHLSNANTDIPSFFRQLKRTLRKHLIGYNVSGYKIFVPGPLFEDIVKHASVKEIWKPWRDAEFYRQDNGENGGFAITSGMQLIEYEEEDLAGGYTIGPVDDILVVPVAAGLFRRFYAPKKGMGTINTPALPRYASTKTLDHDMGEEVRMESNLVTFSEVPEGSAVLDVD